MSLAAWMLYAMVVSFLLGWAARATEAALRAYARPVRTPWAAAMALSAIWPAAAYLGPTALARVQGSAVEPAVSTALPFAAPALEPLEAVRTSAGAAGGWIDGGLAALWLLASASLFALYVGSYLRLRRLRRICARDTVHGTQLLVSERTGPGVAGFWRGWIVIPRWALELERRARRAVLLHEREHLRAGDHRLLHLGMLATAALPWNVPLWWQLRRLRLAVELDCDRRVLSRGVDPEDYGRTLLHVARRRSLARAVPTAFVIEPSSTLEKRIRAMRPEKVGGRAARSVLAAGLAALLVALACAAPTPAPEKPAPRRRPAAAGAPPAEATQMKAKVTGTVVDATTGAPIAGARVELETANRGAVTAENGRYFLVDVEPGIYALRVEMKGYEPVRVEDVKLEPGVTRGLDVALTPARPPEGPVALRDRPVFTPYTQQPEIVDRAKAIEAVERAYPERLRRTGIEGKTTVWLFIDTDGRVKNARVKDSSGYAELDSAAVAAARQFEFTPARNRDKVVPVWIAVPITFTTRHPKEPGARQDTLPLSAAPRPTPFTEPPRIEDRERARAAIVRHYPKGLREQGIGGTTLVWVFIDGRGAVKNARVQKSSGHAELDSAAVAAVREFEFVPARNRDKVVPVWIAIPIRFRVRS